jgi:hypothetical protein
MTYRMITLILALSVVAWAQTASQNATPQQSTPASPKVKCACCDKADAKDAHSCCAHHDMSAHDMSAKEGKEAMSCGGKDAQVLLQRQRTVCHASAGTRTRLPRVAVTA